VDLETWEALSSDDAFLSSWFWVSASSRAALLALALAAARYYSLPLEILQRLQMKTFSLRKKICLTKKKFDG
jgi:hypothetical protein